jgi:hypothetical protein
MFKNFISDGSEIKWIHRNVYGTIKTVLAPQEIAGVKLCNIVTWGYAEHMVWVIHLPWKHTR